MFYKKKYLFLLCFFLLVLLVSWKSPLYQPTKEKFATNVDIQKLEQGRKLYIKKCSSCHTLYLPEEYNKAEWNKYVNSMAPKAKITNEEKELIRYYVTKGN